MRARGAARVLLAGAALTVLAGSPAAVAHHVGSYAPRDNEVSTNFKQIKYAIQARKLDVALRLFDGGALRKEMQVRAVRVPGPRVARPASRRPGSSARGASPCR